MSERGSEAWWARVMWQRHGIPIEEYLDWPLRKKITYIACEQLENSDPVRIYPAILMKKGGG